ncbi:MAG TPA: hypothetical protein VHT91_45805 [Kofleriaceae bacterium]|nr:hypothetical protein [Kofleriaceae bacterium]
MTRAIGLAVAAAALAGCGGTTGGNLVSFDVIAQGAPGGAVHDTSLGWHVELSRAMLYIGAVYLNMTRTNSGIQGTECILPSVYTGQELQGRTIDVLSPAPQPFPAPGAGTDDEVLTGEVWLTGGDVNAETDNTVIADIAGTATKAAQVLPFTATIKINSANRGIPPSSGALPGQNPICKQRIVSPIRIDLHPHDGGTLAVTIDPSLWFDTVDFVKVPPDGMFPDNNTNEASAALFGAIRAATTTYHFSFE